MILIKDLETLKLNTENEMKEYLENRKENDEWIETDISKCRVFTKDENEDLASFMEKNNILASEDAVKSTLEDTKIFLSYIKKGKREAYPLRYTSVDSMLDRAGLAGRTFTNTVEKPGINIMPLDEKLKFITKALKLYNGKCKILIRDEKISAMLSGVYAILPADELMEGLNKVMQYDYPMSEFVNGVASHEYINFSWLLNEEDMEEDMKDRLEELGSRATEVKSGIDFLTSDIGDTNASAYPYFLINGKKMRCEKGVSIKHMGKKTALDFERKLPQMNAMFKKDMERMEELTKIIVNFPDDCFRSVAKNFGLPKKISVRIAARFNELYPETCSAFDVYFHMHEILDAYKDEKSSIVNILKVQESVASTLYADYVKHDSPFLWEKGE